MPSQCRRPGSRDLDPGTAASTAAVRGGIRGRKSRSGTGPPPWRGTRPSTRWTAPGAAAAEAGGFGSGFERCTVDSRRLCCRGAGPRLVPATPSPPSPDAEAAPTAAGSAASISFCDRRIFERLYSKNNNKSYLFLIFQIPIKYNI